MIMCNLHGLQIKYNNAQKYNLMTPVKELNPTHVISQALIR